jgi:hypothetical protein
MPEHGQDRAADPVLAAAYRRVAQAAARVRLCVIARYPHGVPDREELIPSQRDKLVELERAEADLDALRRQRRRKA